MASTTSSQTPPLTPFPPVLHLRPHPATGRGRGQGHPRSRRQRRPVPRPRDPPRRSPGQDARAGKGQLDPRDDRPLDPRAVRRLPDGHPDALRQLPRAVEGLLGQHGQAVADGRLLGQVRGSVRQHRDPGRWPGEHCRGRHELGYKTTFHLLGDNSEVRGGSAWGAGTFANGDGSRMPSAKELEVATAQGKAFYEAVAKVNFQ
jgi:hypothetical protein